MTASDEIRVSRIAEAGAAVGAAGLVTLGLMFAVEVPKGGPYRFGTINDLCGALFSASFIPVAIRVASEVPDDDRLRLATRVAVVAAGAGTVLPLLLVGGALPFAVQAPLAVACIEIQSLWLVALGRALRRVPAGERLARISQLVGGSFIAGSLAFAAGFAAPEGSPLRMGAWVSGGLVGVVGYVGWPYWFHAVAGMLRQPAADVGARGLAWTRS